MEIPTLASLLTTQWLIGGLNQVMIGQLQNAFRYRYQAMDRILVFCAHIVPYVKIESPADTHYHFALSPKIYATQDSAADSKLTCNGNVVYGFCFSLDGSGRMTITKHHAKSLIWLQKYDGNVC